MKDITTHIQKTLNTLYLPEEINCFSRLIFSHVCGLSYNQQILCKDKQICEKEKEEIFAIVKRLKEMEPLQYILGETEFYSLPIKVNPSVLIPRPETEELVDIIIKETLHTPTAINPVSPELLSDTMPQTSHPHYRILDIGTGSGCIAIALAKHIPDAKVTAVDISKDALQTAKKNAKLNNANICFIETDILKSTTIAEFLSGDFDIIVSNPPYITHREKDLMSKNVLGYEPHNALFVPNDDPLLFYKSIADFALKKLASRGMLYFEINANYSTEINEILRKKGFDEIKIIRDLSGKNRFAKARVS